MKENEGETHRPGHSWSSQGKGNRRRTKNGRKNPIRTAVMVEWALRKAKAAGKHYRAAGARVTERGSAQRIFNCPNCGAPVVASQMGREQHARRLPGCAIAMSREIPNRAARQKAPGLDRGLLCFGSRITHAD
jgi:predicted RNA-binding Zn-ribbon protein involved in translation (DUF1610 family)